MVKPLPNWLKIHVQSQFGPNFPVEFEAFFRKKLGLAFICKSLIFFQKEQTENDWLVTRPGQHCHLAEDFINHLCVPVLQGEGQLVHEAHGGESGVFLSQASGWESSGLVTNSIIFC